MKCFTINGNEIVPHIEISIDPYPRIVLGEGGNKRSTWIPIGTRDAASLIKEENHGEYKINVMSRAGVVKMKKNGKYLIVAERNNEIEDKVLVLIKWVSGYRGGSGFLSPEHCVIVAEDKAWHSGRGSTGETAEILVVMRPGERVVGIRSGRRVEVTHCIIKYDGRGKFSVGVGDEFIVSGEHSEEEVEEI